MLAVWLMVRRRPALASRLPGEALRARLASLRAALPVLALFMPVIGGIYGGVFTPADGGDIGAAGTLILALVMRRRSWMKMKESLNASACFITMCFTVLSGVTAPGAFMTLNRIPRMLAEAMASTGMPGRLTMAAILVVLIIPGRFIPSMPLLPVCVSIFMPIARVYERDLVRFGMLMVLMMNMAGIRPPFGIHLFAMEGLACALVAQVPGVGVVCGGSGPGHRRGAGLSGHDGHMAARPTALRRT